MKALTLWQPWASLWAAGIKKNETRSWATMHRGPLLIHAAKLTHMQLADKIGATAYFKLSDICVDTLGILISDLPRGCIVGRVDVVDCLPTLGAGWEKALEASVGDLPRLRHSEPEQQHALPLRASVRPRDGGPMSDDAITVNAYLVIKGKRNYWSTKRIIGGKVARATIGKPGKLLRDEIAVKIGIVVPLACFEPLNLTDAGLVEVPSHHILSPAFFTEAPVEDEEDE